MAELETLVAEENEVTTEVNGKATLKKEEAIDPETAWKGYQKIAFRVAFVFFIAMSLPTSAEWYANLFSIDWTSLHYRDIYDLARFSSGFSFVGNTIFGNNLLGYANWIITLGVAIVAGLIWTLVDGRRKSPAREYNLLYYWLRTIVRYRAGIGIIGFGFTKLLPVQMPYPGQGILNTDFGDFTAQKIYWLSIGIVPWYQVFAGVVEILAGALLFFRGTAAIGAALLIGALGSITFVNFAYDGGVHGYASYFVLLGTFVLAYYIPRIYNLLIRERLTIPVDYYPSFSRPWEKYSRYVLKGATFGIFIFLLFYLQLINFIYDPYKQPSGKGVTQLRGYYDVAEFRINGVSIPYSPLDTVRWQEVTFENWSSLSFKVNRAVALDLSNGGGSPMRDINRTFELAGVGGGRRVFYYDADTVNHILFLQDKNVAGLRRNGRGEGNPAQGAAPPEAAPQEGPKEPFIAASSLPYITDENARIDERARSTRRTRGIASETKRDPNRKKMILTYSTTDGDRVILKGTSEDKDSLYVVLNRIERKYELSESTLSAGKY